MLEQAVLVLLVGAHVLEEGLVGAVVVPGAVELAVVGEADGEVEVREVGYGKERFRTEPDAMDDGPS